jgi:hypothetical protein
MRIRCSCRDKECQTYFTIGENNGVGEFWFFPLGRREALMYVDRRACLRIARAAMKTFLAITRARMLARFGLRKEY